MRMIWLWRGVLELGLGLGGEGEVGGLGMGGGGGVARKGRCSCELVVRRWRVPSVNRGGLGLRCMGIRGRLRRYVFV